MLNIDVKFIGEEVIFNLERIPGKVREAMTFKLHELIGALKGKVEDSVSAKLGGKRYSSMFESGVEQIGSAAIGFVEFKPSDKWYAIRVGGKGVLANKETGFFSRKDVLHPPMKSASIETQFNEAYQEMRPMIVEGLEDALFEAVYGP